MLAIAWLDGYADGTRETATRILTPEAFDSLIDERQHSVKVVPEDDTPNAA